MKQWICAGLILMGVGCTKSAPESERQLATRVLAEYVAKTAAPKKVVVLSNPFTKKGGSPQAAAFEEAGIAGLKEGFGKNLDLEVEFPAVRPEVLRDPGSVPVDPQSTTPLSFLVTEEAFSEAVQKQPDAEVVVSLIGLPVKLNGFRQWNAEGKPVFALLLPDWRIIGDRSAITQAFHRGKLAAAVVRKPNAPEDEVSGDSSEEFDRRYVLVTRENVDALIAENPVIFGLR
jgi:hypothetical protein